MISKELLSEVLKEKTDKPNMISDDLLAYGVDDEDYNTELLKYKEINIYELAHKCKEWALKHIIDKEIQSTGCAITSWIISNGKGKARILIIDKSFIANTEVEVIIKACEWILKEIKK